MSAIIAYTQEAEQAFGELAATVLLVKAERGKWQAYEAGKRILDTMNLSQEEWDRRRKALEEMLGL